MLSLGGISYLRTAGAGDVSQHRTGILVIHDELQRRAPLLHDTHTTEPIRRGAAVMIEIFGVDDHHKVGAQGAVFVRRTRSRRPGEKRHGAAGVFRNDMLSPDMCLLLQVQVDDPVLMTCSSTVLVTPEGCQALTDPLLDPMVVS